MPKIVVIVGEAGSGKDTFAEYVRRHVPCKTDAFAAPFKDFAGKVFGFSDLQLYGPSEHRNRNHLSLSYDGHPLSLMDKIRRFFGRPPKEPIPIETIVANRAATLKRYAMYAVDFAWELHKFVDMDHSTIEANLTKIITQIMAMRNITPRIVLQLIGSEFGRALSKTLWVDMLAARAQQQLDAGNNVLVRDGRFLNEIAFGRARGWLAARVTRSVIPIEGGVVGHVSELDIRKPEMDQLITHEIDNTKTLDDLAEAACRFAFANLIGIEH